MNYLGRPVFLFTPNWADAIQRDLTYELRELLIGFGAEYFTPTASYTTNAWSFELLLKNGADFLAFEDFCDALVGRLDGFWLPTPLQAAQLSAGISTSQFKIVTEGLADTWNTRPDQHLLFTFADGTQAAGLIQGVVDNGDGTETVTLTAALPQAPAARTSIVRLHYCRWAADTEKYKFLAENKGTIKLTAVELPLEYTNAQAGLQPIYLYDFHMAAPVGLHWRYTSFAAPVVSGGKLFANFPMTHKQIQHGVDGQSNALELEAKYDAAHALALLAGTPPGRVLWLDVLVCYFATPDVTTKLWSGFVSSVKDDGQKLTATANTRLAWLKTKTPRFLLGSTCNWTLYEPATCKVGRAPFETTLTITDLPGTLPPVLKGTFNFGFDLADWQTDDWFKGGIFETGFGTSYEIRSITKSHWDGAKLNLTLNLPLKFADVNQPAQITAGCDHTAATCKAKFNNFKNFGGFVAIPQRNLSLQAIETSAASGGKK